VHVVFRCGLNTRKTFLKLTILHLTICIMFKLTFFSPVAQKMVERVCTTRPTNLLLSKAVIFRPHHCSTYSYVDAA